MATPEVKVKFGAEGADAVTNALNKVKSGAEAAGKAGAGGISQLNSALGGLKSLLPTITFAGIVTGITAAVTKVINLADELGDLSAQTGASVEALSTVQIAAQKVGIEFEDVKKLFAGFSKSITELQSGSKGAAEDFGKIGISAKDLKGLNTDQIFQKVVDRLGAMPGSLEKTALEMKLFGKAGREADELITNLAGGGMEQLKIQARETGQLIGTDMANSADAMKKQLAALEAKATATAVSFTTGFAPQITEALADVQNATTGPSGVGNAFSTLGELVGLVVRAIMVGLTGIGLTLGAIGGTIKDLVTGNWGDIGWRWSHLGEQIKRAAGGDAMAQIKEANDAAIKAEQDRKSREGQPPKGKETTGAGGGGKSDTLKQAEADAKAELDMLKALRENEYQLTKTYLDITRKSLQDAYEDGIISLTEYMETRGQIINQAADDEIAKLQAEYAAVAAMTPKNKAEASKQQADLSGIATKVWQTDVKRVADINEVSRDWLAKQRQITTDLINLDIRRLEIEGNAYAARQKRYELEQKAYREDLSKPGLNKSPEEIDAAVQALADSQAQQDAADYARTTGEVYSRLNDLSGNYYQNEKKRVDDWIAEKEKELAELGRLESEKANLDKLREAEYAGINYNRQQEDIRDFLDYYEVKKQEITTSTDTEWTKNQKILELERQILPMLQQKIFALMQIAAMTGDQSKILEAQQLQLQANQLETSINAASNAFYGLKNQVFGAAQDAFVNFFTSGIAGAKGLGDAFRGLASSVVSSLQQIIGKMIAMYLWQKLIGMVGGLFGLGGGATGGAGAIQSTGIRVATGGLIRGPGTGTSDSIPAWLSNGEYVMSAAAVSRPGVLSMLRSINEGLTVRRPSYGNHFAEGGLVGGPVAADDPRPGRLDIGLDDGLIVKFLESPRGQKVLVRSIGQSKRAIKGVLS